MRIPQVADVNEFVRWEERQEERYEFADGEISLLPEAMPRHEIIVLNVASTLRTRLC